MKELTLTQKEQARLQVLNRVLEGWMSVEQAAKVLGVSERHLWRILAAYRKEGAATLAHGNRGRRPGNAVDGELREEVITLSRTRYQGVNHTHLTELLEERHGLTLSRSAVRRILREAGMESPRRRRPPRHRVRRERMAQPGMLLQLDGSVHPWLEDRGPELTLLFAVDDAIGTIPHAVFREQEDTRGYFLLMDGVLRQEGIPLALYSDRHGVFQASWEFRTPSHESGLTQFGRAMGELGVEQLFALSPQAKGRVERIGGILQDRLVAELRLAGASTPTEANSVLAGFLPRFNHRFGVQAANGKSAYRPIPHDLELAGILCFKTTRKVARDNTVKYQWRTLQLLPDASRPTYAGSRVEVQERLDSSLVVAWQGCPVPTREAPPRASVLRNATGKAAPHVVQAGSAPDLGSDRQRPPGLREAPAGNARRRFADGSTLRQPTPLQRARWEAVQEAKARGLTLRAMARELGMSRVTIRKYAAAISPPVNGMGWFSTDQPQQGGH